jgi:hypothetical protein
VASRSISITRAVVVRRRSGWVRSYKGGKLDVLPEEAEYVFGDTALQVLPGACPQLRVLLRGGQVRDPRRAYRVGLYDAMGPTGTTAGLARDQFSFVQDQGGLGGTFTAFVASFVGPNVANKADFERLLGLDYNNTVYLTTGNVLYSNQSRPMFTIFEDRVGKHDFLLTPCSQETFDILCEGHEGYHPSCFENLTKNVKQFRIAKDDIPTTFIVLMNVDILQSGELRIGPPLSKPGEFVDLRGRWISLSGLGPVPPRSTTTTASNPSIWRFAGDTPEHAAGEAVVKAMPEGRVKFIPWLPGGDGNDCGAS